MVETLALPGINGSYSVQDCPDLLGASSIGSIAAGPLLVSLALQFDCPVSRLQLLVRAHVRQTTKQTGNRSTTAGTLG
ncbi:hypothetical protein A5755_04530 [Mycolicibacterium fortuitum]|nr:hypothetical protein A5763_13385 [Mycolicibacterium fortuitum]OBB51418.1 hypothetical protein A5754_24140 [Mycolicibacterium fortuitum]OBB51596.1 hypothetical protein A5755_04530 [Mycolicibacterium fortuitum]OBF77417.1 hypothetical protein A5751_22500 [Mycolicibacterium fortuitum]OBG23927.1 hypothetical protein A5768_22405 [Mycolicibacterium fortuitum]